MEIFLIDGIGPFFRDLKKRQINWSKIPFHFLGKTRKDCRRQFAVIAADLEIFAKRVSSEGYNSISLDDVAHLTPHDWLEPEINQLIEIYQEEYRKLFTICREHGLNIYLTMDILSLTPRLKSRINGNSDLVRDFLRKQVETVLSTFPEVRGLILRIGECDGKDVKGVFISELVLQTPKQVNRLLVELLPIMEKHNRYLILRNWTVGAYRIGDLIWHRHTMSRALRGITSQNFILSLKYGESDFFRYLPLNKHFFHHEVKKIVELQARREYEGCGEYPSFIGWDYGEYAQQLKHAKNMVGISVWCQTGGWLPFRRLSYLEKEGLWNELNSYLCIQLFKEKQTVDQAIFNFAQQIQCNEAEKLSTFLKLNDEVIKELLYIREIAGQKLFFRRVRIPPLINVLWNNIFINHSLRKVLLALVGSGEKSVSDGYAALTKIKQMRDLAEELGLPVKDIDFMYESFSLLALAREYYFLPYNSTLRKRITKAKRKYKKIYPKGERPRYRIKTNFSPFTMRQRHIQWLLSISLRKKRGYRLLDYLLTLHLLGFLYRFTVKIKPSLIPKFARKKAMGIDTIFK